MHAFVPRACSVCVCPVHASENMSNSVKAYWYTSKPEMTRYLGIQHKNVANPINVVHVRQAIAKATYQVARGDTMSLSVLAGIVIPQTEHSRTAKLT